MSKPIHNLKSNNNVKRHSRVKPIQEKVRKIIWEILRFDWRDGRYNSKNIPPIIEGWVEKIMNVFNY
jgi:hypothetical protein